MTDNKIPETELIFKAVRSGGKGGQNVNKVSTKVELLFDVANSPCLSESEKQRITFKLKSKIDKTGILRIVSQSERSQLLNKKSAVKKFNDIISRSLILPRKRIKTAPTNASETKRLERKKIISEKKAQRTKFITDD
jgi:ribosome-associated protein